MGNFIIERSLKSDEDFEIIDMTGKSIKKGKLSDKSEKLDISENETGVYFLKLNNRLFKLIKI